MKQVARTRRATRDIEQTFDDYLGEVDGDTAERFLNKIDAAIAHIREFPGTGSPRYSKLLTAKRLRFWLLDKFPYAVFYIETAQHIEIIRLLHQASDIPQHLKK